MTKFNESYIIKEYLAKRTTKSIALELKTYNTTIRRILLRNNIVPRTSAEHWSNRDNPFKDLSNPIVQYWLGIIASDGNIGKDKSNRIVLQLSYKDSYLVDQFATFVQAKAYDIYNKKYNLTERRCSFRDKAIKETLISYGITSNKSKTLKINIPVTFDFLRGVIDGDGYVRTLKTSANVEIASASKDFAKQLLSFLQTHSIKATLRFNGSIFIVGIYTKDSVKTLGLALYKTATIYLKRKKNSFGPLLQEIKEDATSSNSENLAGEF